MIQDIAPHIFHNEYRNVTPEKEDDVLYFDEEGKILSSSDGSDLLFPVIPAPDGDTVYLFSIDEKKYHLYLGNPPVAPGGYEYQGIRGIRDRSSGTGVFAAFTAYHMWKWYTDNRFCGS